MTKVLGGIRVLDFGRFIACPFAGHQLAQMGASTAISAAPSTMLAFYHR